MANNFSCWGSQNIYCLFCILCARAELNLGAIVTISLVSISDIVTDIIVSYYIFVAYFEVFSYTKWLVSRYLNRVLSQIVRQTDQLKFILLTWSGMTCLHCANPIREISKSHIRCPSSHTRTDSWRDTWHLHPSSHTRTDSWRDTWHLQTFNKPLMIWRARGTRTWRVGCPRWQSSCHFRRTTLLWRASWPCWRPPWRYVASPTRWRSCRAGIPRTPHTCCQERSPAAQKVVSRAHYIRYYTGHIKSGTLVSRNFLREPPT